MERIFKTHGVGDTIIFNDLILAWITIRTLAGIKTNITALQKYASQIIGIYRLGFHFGYKRTQESGHANPKLYENYCHRKISSEIIKEKRWEPFHQKRQEQLLEIKSITIKYYENGGRMLHHDFASQFWNSTKYQEQYGKIPKAKIRKAVGEVAEKFGFKIGVRKAKKS